MKDTQIPGGIAGFSLKLATVKQYYITAENRGAFIRQLRHMVQTRQDSQHADLQKYEQAVSGN